MILTFKKKDRANRVEELAKFEADIAPSKGELITLYRVKEKKKQIVRVMDINTTYTMLEVYDGEPPLVATS